MDNMFVWLLIFAGAAIGLLSTFLIASERELKKTRRQIDALATNPEGVPTDPSPSATVETPAAAAQPSAEMIATQRRLEEEVASLSSKLEMSEKTVAELHAEKGRLDGAQNEILQLRSENQRLHEESARLENQLQAAANQPPVAASPADAQVSERQTQLEAEVAELKSRLDASEVKARELEAERQELSASAARESSLMAQQQQLEAQIAGLQNELAMARAKADELQAGHERSLELQRLYDASRAENRQLEQESSRWQERLAQSQEYGRRLVSLGQELNDMQAQQAALVQLGQDMQAKLAAMNRNIPAAPEDMSETATAAVSPRMQRSVIELGGEVAVSAKPNGGESQSPPSTSEPVSNTPGAAAVAIGDHQTPAAPPNTAPVMSVSSTAKSNGGLGISSNGNRRVGILAGILVLAIAGAFAGGLFSKSTDKSASALNPPTTVATAVAAKEQPETLPTDIESGAEAPTTVTGIADGPDQRSAEQPQEKPSRHDAGTYEIIRRTQVYSGPSESTRLVADIEPGTKINVVSQRDGWLEVRSKHGRPPGFIRREAAAKARRN